MMQSLQPGRHTPLRVSYLALLALSYWAAAVCCTDTFMTRWGFRENAEGFFGFETMLSGDAARPWAYRVLIPVAVTSLANVVTENSDIANSKYFAETSGVRDRYFRGSPERWTPEFSLKYHITLALAVSSLFAFLWFLRAISSRFQVDNPVLRDLGPVCLALLLPMAYLKGGYMYDFPELMLLGACFLAAVSSPVALLILIPIAVLNKETAILLPFILAPLFFQPAKLRYGLSILASCIVTSLVTYVLVRQAMSGNAGGTVEQHFRDNFAFWIQPTNYFDFSMMLGAGMPMPKMHSLIVLLPLALLSIIGWAHASTKLRQTLLLSLALNVPLLLLFGDKDELRNLSLIFVPLYLLVLIAAQTATTAASTTSKSRRHRLP